MGFDFKREDRALYLPARTPGIVAVPALAFLAVRGAGDPNEAEGAYARAVEALYGVAYTLKMSRRGGREVEGFFDYVVPPLEGFWWQEGVQGMDYARKAALQWISVIRLPDFFGPGDVDWAIGEAGRRKKRDFSSVAYWAYEEGLCVQCLHVGPYDDEPETVRAMDDFAREAGYAVDISQARHHHEIYLSDPRRGDPQKRRTVLRHPVAPV